jgi:integrase
MFKDFKAPTPAATIPHPLPEGIDGVRRLIGATHSETHRALVTLCGFCGCRVSEAISVRASNFDLYTMLLEIRGKGDKVRHVPVSPEAWEHLAGPVLKSRIAGDKLVVNILDRNARAVVTKLGERAGLIRHISSHDLRATFATAVHDKTHDLKLVQELLGHSTSKTTEGYVLTRLEKMRSAVVL